MDEIPETVIFLISVTLVILLGIIDYLTGYELAFSIFYLQPISLVSWFVKKSYAVIICILSAITWLLADIYDGDIYSIFIYSCVECIYKTWILFNNRFFTIGN